MDVSLVELIGLRERIEKRLVGVLPMRHRVNAVIAIGTEFNQLLRISHQLLAVGRSTQSGNGAAARDGGSSPSVAGSPVAAGAAPLSPTRPWPVPKLFAVVRPFHLIRMVDHSGVSGTGIVAEGVQFTTGRVALHWTSNEPSTTAWDNVEAMLRVHGHGGDTVLRWLDELPANDDGAGKSAGGEALPAGRVLTPAPSSPRSGHVTEVWPTGRITDCMATAPTGGRINPADASSALTYHVCRMELAHDDAHLCCACDHTWPRAEIS